MSDSLAASTSADTATSHLAHNLSTPSHPPPPPHYPTAPAPAATDPLTQFMMSSSFLYPPPPPPLAPAPPLPHSAAATSALHQAAAAYAAAAAAAYNPYAAAAAAAPPGYLLPPPPPPPYYHHHHHHPYPYYLPPPAVPAPPPLPAPPQPAYDPQQYYAQMLAALTTAAPSSSPSAAAAAVSTTTPSAAAAAAASVVVTPTAGSNNNLDDSASSLASAVTSNNHNKSVCDRHATNTKNHRHSNNAAATYSKTFTKPFGTAARDGRRARERSSRTTQANATSPWVQRLHCATVAGLLLYRSPAQRNTAKRRRCYRRSQGGSTAAGRNRKQRRSRSAKEMDSGNSSNKDDEEDGRDERHDATTNPADWLGRVMFLDWPPPPSQPQSNSNNNLNDERIAWFEKGNHLKTAFLRWSESIMVGTTTQNSKTTKTSPSKKRTTADSNNDNENTISSALLDSLLSRRDQVAVAQLTFPIFREHVAEFLTVYREFCIFGEVLPQKESKGGGATTPTLACRSPAENTLAAVTRRLSHYRDGKSILSAVQRSRRHRHCVWLDRQRQRQQQQSSALLLLSPQQRLLLRHYQQHEQEPHPEQQEDAVGLLSNVTVAATTKEERVRAQRKREFLQAKMRRFGLSQVAALNGGVAVAGGDDLAEEEDEKWEDDDGVDVEDEWSEKQRARKRLRHQDVIQQSLQAYNNHNHNDNDNHHSCGTSTLVAQQQQQQDDTKPAAMPAAVASATSDGWRQQVERLFHKRNVAVRIRQTSIHETLRDIAEDRWLIQELLASKSSSSSSSQPVDAGAKDSSTTTTTTKDDKTKTSAWEERLHCAMVAGLLLYQAGEKCQVMRVQQRYDSVLQNPAKWLARVWFSKSTVFYRYHQSWLGKSQNTGLSGNSGRSNLEVAFTHAAQELGKAQGAFGPLSKQACRRVGALKFGTFQKHVSEFLVMHKEFCSSGEDSLEAVNRRLLLQSEKVVSAVIGLVVHIEMLTAKLEILQGLRLSS